MKKILNTNTLLLAIGVLQPTRILEIKGFLKATFGEDVFLPTDEELQRFLNEQIRRNRVILVATKPFRLYSLTYAVT